MFDQLFTRTRTIARHQAGPSLALRVSYLEHLFKNGMCRARIREVAARIYRLSTAMDLDAVQSVSVRDLEIFAGKWAHRKNPPGTFRSPHGPRKEMLCMTKSWMRFLGRLDDSRPVRRPHSEKILAFQAYLAEENGLSAKTITVRSW